MMPFAEWLCRPFRRVGKGGKRRENPIIARILRRYGTVCGVNEKGRKLEVHPSGRTSVLTQRRSPPCGLTNQNAASAHAIARKCAILCATLSPSGIEAPSTGRKMKPRVRHSGIFSRDRCVSSHVCELVARQGRTTPAILFLFLSPHIAIAQILPSPSLAEDYVTLMSFLPTSIKL